MTPFASLRTHEIESFEELNEIVLGTRRQVVQIEHGKIHGRLSHASIAGLPLDHATFDLGIRSNGGSPRDRYGIGLLLEASNRVTWSSYECVPGHVMARGQGYFAACSGIVSGSASILSGAIYARHGQGVYYVMAAMALSGALVMWLARHRLANQPHNAASGG